MKSILFLDFDGVLTATEKLWEPPEPVTEMSDEERERFVHSLYAGREAWVKAKEETPDGERPDAPIPYHKFDPDAVEALNQIIEEAMPFLVVSSSWRIIKSDSRLQDILAEQGVIMPRSHFLGSTPQAEGVRGHEIELWLEENAPDVLVGTGGTFAILDDETDMGPFPDHLVHVDRSVGLTPEDARRTVDLLT